MTEASVEIIRMLREARLGWIADELVEALALGRQTAKKFREPGAKRDIKATTIEPFSPEDEMEVIVETLAQYFMVIPGAWSIARRQFATRGTFASVSTKESLSPSTEVSPTENEHFSVVLGIAGDGDQAFQEFGTTYESETLPAVREVLGKLWPRGGDDFAQKFYREETQKP